MRVLLFQNNKRATTHSHNHRRTHRTRTHARKHTHNTKRLPCCTRALDSAVCGNWPEPHTLGVLPDRDGLQHLLEPAVRFYNHTQANAGPDYPCVRALRRVRASCVCLRARACVCVSVRGRGFFFFLFLRAPSGGHSTPHRGIDCGADAFPVLLMPIAGITTWLG